MHQLATSHLLIMIIYIHSRDPVPGDDDNETLRQEIGNQDQGIPTAHGAFNSQFEQEDEDNVNENC